MVVENNTEIFGDLVARHDLLISTSQPNLPDTSAREAGALSTMRDQQTTFRLCVARIVSVAGVGESCDEMSCSWFHVLYLGSLSLTSPHSVELVLPPDDHFDFDA